MVNTITRRQSRSRGRSESKERALGEKESGQGRWATKIMKPISGDFDRKKQLKILGGSCMSENISKNAPKGGSGGFLQSNSISQKRKRGRRSTFPARLMGKKSLKKNRARTLKSSKRKKTSSWKRKYSGRGGKGLSKTIAQENSSQRRRTQGC